MEFKQGTKFEGDDMIFEEDKLSLNNFNEPNISGNELVDISGLEVYLNSDDNWKEIRVNGRLIIIPKDWKIVKFGDIAVGKTGTTPPTKNQNNFIGNIKWINISDMNDKIVSNEKFLNHNIESLNKKKLEKGSLLFSFKLSIGKVGFTKYNDMVTNEAIIAYEPSKNKNLLYLYYLMPKFVVLNARQNAYGAKLMNTTLIKNAKVPITNSEKEQTKIASVLTKQEDIIEKLDKKIELTKKEIKYFQQELLSGRLRIREIDNDGTNDNNKTENIEFYKNPDDNWKEVKVNGRLIMIPKDWEVSKIGEVSEFKPGFAFKRKEITNIISNFKLLKIGNIGLNGIFKSISKNQFYLENDNNVEFKLLKGDLILAMDDLTPDASYIGTTTIIKENNCYLNQRIGSFKDLSINKFYLNKFINKNQKFFKQISTGSTAKNLSKKSIEKISIYFPKEIQEQNLIANFLIKLDDNLENIEISKQKEEKTFTYLQQELLSGRVRVK